MFEVMDFPATLMQPLHFIHGLRKLTPCPINMCNYYQLEFSVTKSYHWKKGSRLLVQEQAEKISLLFMGFNCYLMARLFTFVTFATLHGLTRCCGLKENCPPWDHVPEYLVPSRWHCLRSKGIF